MNGLYFFQGDVFYPGAVQYSSVLKFSTWYSPKPLYSHLASLKWWYNQPLQIYNSLFEHHAVIPYLIKLLTTCNVLDFCIFWGILRETFLIMEKRGKSYFWVCSEEIHGSIKTIHARKPIKMLKELKPVMFPALGYRAIGTQFTEKFWNWWEESYRSWEWKKHREARFFCPAEGPSESCCRTLGDLVVYNTSSRTVTRLIFIHTSFAISFSSHQQWSSPPTPVPSSSWRPSWCK